MTLKRWLSNLHTRPDGPNGSTLRNLWTEVMAVTSDGRTVRIEAGFTRDSVPGESLPETSDAIAMDAVERALRSYIGSVPARMVPMPGARLKQVEKSLVPHEVIGNIVVLTADTATDDDLLVVGR